MLGISGMTGMSKVFGKFRMPAMRGMTVFLEIRRNPVTSGIPETPKMTGMPRICGMTGMLGMLGSPG